MKSLKLLRRVVPIHLCAISRARLCHKSRGPLLRAVPGRPCAVCHTAEQAGYIEAGLLCFQMCILFDVVIILDRLNPQIKKNLEMMTNSHAILAMQEKIYRRFHRFLIAQGE